MSAIWDNIKIKLESWLVEDSFSTICKLTLVLLLLHSSGYWYARDPIRFFCIAGLAFPFLLKQPNFWFIISCFICSINILQWYELDNHKYLMSYWCITIFIATAQLHKRDEILFQSARWLIGLAMFFAVVWKLISPDYLDGRFFSQTLLVDSRFFRFTSLLSGISMEDLLLNERLETTLKAGYMNGLSTQSVLLKGATQIRPLALFMTYWTIIIESAFALAFLWPHNRCSEWVRNSLLVAFAVTTYSVATVTGFAWLLLTMGIAQTSEPLRFFRTIFIGIFLLIVIYGMPFGELFERTF